MTAHRALPGLSRSRGVVVVEVRPGLLWGGSFDATGVLQGQAEVPATGAIGRDVLRLRDALRSGSPKASTRVLWVSDQATTACLELPPLKGLPAHERESMVRFELEPLLSDAQGVVCGWAPRGVEDPAPGAVLAAGVGREARAEVETACRQAGWRLEGLYPRLACGAAVPADFEDAVVVEVAPDALALTQLREGAVVRAHVLRETSGAMAADRVAAWAGAQPLVVLGALDPDTHAILQASVAELRVVECSLSPSVQGAVRHAFGLAGGERVAAVAGREPAPPLWQRHGVRAAAFVVGWAGLWGAVDVVLERQYQAVRAQHAELDQRSRTRRLQATAVQALTKEREALEGQLAEARAAAELHTQRAQRAGYLVQLLDVLGRAADDGVALRGLEDTLNELTLRGYARSPDEAHTYLHRVELALQPHGLRLTERMVERDPQDPLYTFSATLRRPETP